MNQMTIQILAERVVNTPFDGANALADAGSSIIFVSHSYGAWTHAKPPRRR
jgi:hypothetical protein